MISKSEKEKKKKKKKKKKKVIRVLMGPLLLDTFKLLSGALVRLFFLGGGPDFLCGGLR